MAAKQKEWARKARVSLLAVLGNKCVDCDATEKLEFDCIVPCGDKHHRMDTSARMSFYRRQHREGNLALRCSRCNGLKGDNLPAVKIVEKDVDESNPF